MKRTETKTKKPVKRSKKDLLRQQWIRDLIALVERLPKWNDTFKEMPPVTINKENVIFNPTDLNPAFVKWAKEKIFEFQMQQWEDMMPL